MIDFLNSIDSEILLFLNSLHSPFFDRFMPMATGRFVWAPFYAALVLMLLYRFGWRRGLVWIAATALCITLADQLCATVIRPLVGRLRPANELNPLSQWIHIVDGYRGGRYGFPSCHGSNSFALATIIALIAHRRSITLLMIGWATLNVYTRIYLGVHYPGDILAGAAIGAMSAVLFYFGAKRTIARYAIPLPEGRPSLLVPAGIHAGGVIEMKRLLLPRLSTLPLIILPLTLFLLLIISIP